MAKKNKKNKNGQNASTTGTAAVAAVLGNALGQILADAAESYFAKKGRKKKLARMLRRLT
jgi:hypothetical protein